MNETKVVLLCAVGLTLGSAMAVASAADTATKMAPAKSASGMMGYTHHMKGHGDCHYKHDMMGNYGHGMTGGMGMMGGMGMGMMMESPRAGMVRTLSLSDEQRAKINKLSDKLHHDNWADMGKIMDESTKLRDLYEADRRDANAIAGVYRNIFNTKIEMIKAMVSTENEIEDLLTKDQLAQLKAMRKNMGSMRGYSMMH